MLEGAEREGSDQQNGYYYELEKHHMKCAEKGALEDLRTASREGVGVAERCCLSHIYWQTKAHVFSVLFPLYLEE